MGLYLLNLADLLFTMYALRHGGAELNPFMQSVPFMILYKTVFVGGLLLWLAGRPEKAAQWGIRICTAVYAGVDVWHIYNLALAWAA